jgi:hypothetical protein
MNETRLRFVSNEKQKESLFLEIQVANPHGIFLGYIEWYRDWQKYVYISATGIANDEYYLDEVSAKLKELNSK